jgi:DNA-binding transcriptional LysR family regulator
MELRHLRDFVAVAEELSFTRAAKKLHIAQPSLTHQIKLLEEELGVTLLDRIKGRVSLTEPGRSFLEDAKRVLALSAESVETARLLSRNQTRQLKIGYVSNLHHQLLPHALGAFNQAYPEVAVNLFDMTPAEQFEALETGKVDLGFVGLRESLMNASLEGQEVIQYEIVVALPHSSPLSKKRRIEFKDFAGLLFVGLSERAYPGWKEAVYRPLAAAGFIPRTLQEADGMPSTLAFVSAGIGAALVPEQIKLLPHSGVVFRPLKTPFSAKSWIAWRRNPSGSLQQYLQMVRQLFNKKNLST